MNLLDWWRRRRAHAIACRAAADLMTDYLEGALDRRDHARFEGHLAACTACTAHLEEMRLTIAALGRLPAPTLPDDVREELVGLYRAYHGE